MKYHTTKDGKKILIKDLKDNHLHNIIKWIEKKSRDGVLIEEVIGDLDGFYYDRYFLYGDDVKEELNYGVYVNELKNRGGIK